MGGYLPTRRHQFGGRINMDAQELQAVLAAARRAAQGRAQRSPDHDRRPGLRHFEHLRRCHPDANAGPGREGRASIYAVPLHLALLALASGAAHRTQPSLGGIWRDCRAGHRLSRTMTPSSGGTTRPSAKSSERMATRLPGSARITTRQATNTACRDPSINGRAEWASNIFTASWAARPTSGQPWLFRDHTQIFPWVGNPGYNLITDMADEAIKHIKGLNAAAPDQPFFVYYAPGGSHAPHQPTPEWIKKISDMHLFDKGWERSARADLRQSEAARRDPGEYPAHALAGWTTRIRRSQAREMGHAFRRGKEALHPSGGRLRRLRRLHRP